MSRGWKFCRLHPFYECTSYNEIPLFADELEQAIPLPELLLDRGETAGINCRHGNAAAWPSGIGN